MIKYHDNLHGRQYGDDHQLTNNWNPNKDYGNEYVNVYFRIDTQGYVHPFSNFTDEDRSQFGSDIARIFGGLGWLCDEPGSDWAGSTWESGWGGLYVHPQNISGCVLKNDVKEIAEALLQAEYFTLRWVDLYSTVYDITEDEYAQYLESIKDEIEKILIKEGKTSRRNLFHDAEYNINQVAAKVRLNRVQGEYYGWNQTYEYVQSVLQELVKAGYIVATTRMTADEEIRTIIRTINKTERREKKLPWPIEWEQ